MTHRLFGSEGAREFREWLKIKQCPAARSIRFAKGFEK
jgi:hypothetical protein